LLTRLHVTAVNTAGNLLDASELGYAALANSVCTVFS